MIFSDPQISRSQPKTVVPSSDPATSGLRAVARLLGTAVMLTAARSGGATTAIT